MVCNPSQKDKKFSQFEALIRMAGKLKHMKPPTRLDRTHPCICVSAPCSHLLWVYHRSVRASSFLERYRGPCQRSSRAYAGWAISTIGGIWRVPVYPHWPFSRETILLGVAPFMVLDYQWFMSLGDSWSPLLRYFVLHRRPSRWQWFHYSNTVIITSKNGWDTRNTM